MWILTIVFLLSNGDVQVENFKTENASVCVESANMLIEENFPVVAFSCSKAREV